MLWNNPEYIYGFCKSSTIPVTPKILLKYNFVNLFTTSSKSVTFSKIFLGEIECSEDQWLSVVFGIFQPCNPIVFHPEMYINDKNARLATMKGKTHMSQERGRFFWSSCSLGIIKVNIVSSEFLRISPIPLVVIQKSPRRISLDLNLVQCDRCERETHGKYIQKICRCT